MIEIEGLTKHYRDRVAIEDVSFKVARGNIVAFLGPNGAGKSTTLKILCGYMPATRGRVRICGYDVFEQPMQVKRRIGYLPEVPPVYPDLTVREYLLFVGRLKGLHGAALRREVCRCAARVNMADVLDRLIGNLSKGFQQRTGLAQALLGNPEVLILDEPTVGLDPRQIGEVRQLIVELAAEHTIILSTHILSEVTATCQHVVVINQGRIVADDSLTGLVQKHRDPDSDTPASLEAIFLSLTEN
jgi:ABC-2 type transport system ATP-binding protein